MRTVASSFCGVRPGSCLHRANFPPVTDVIAHRGASASHPENTVAAFREARRVGASMVELDVRRTADAHLAVHHDATLPGGQPLNRVFARDLPPWVPLFDEALEACAGMVVNAEIKE